MAWTSESVFPQNSASEDQDAAFSDIDRDGDLDLIVISGSIENDSGDVTLSDRIYLNDGTGKFTHSQADFAGRFNSSCLSLIDFDQDGDEDLMIGGGLRYKAYPQGYGSKLFQNNKGRFTDVSSKLLPDHGRFGMVKRMETADLNGDTYPELILVNEWGPVTILWNQNGKAFSKASLPQSGGWWNAVKAKDLDGDGDLDFICGNRGENNFFSASQKKPAKLYEADFDYNHIREAIPTYYYPPDSNYFPKHSRDMLGMQLSLVRSRFVSYEAYGKAGISDIFLPEELAKATRYEVHTFSSTVFINEGNEHFRSISLPRGAQMAQVNDIIVRDLNGDRKADLILAGNDHWLTHETGRYDGLGVLILLGNGDGTFRENFHPAIKQPHTTDPKKMLIIRNGQEEYLILANYGKALMAFRLSNTPL